VRAEPTLLIPKHLVPAAFQRPEQRLQTRRRGAEIGQYPQTVRLGRGPHDPGQHHRPERLVGQGIEPEPAVGVRQHLPQQQRGRAHQATAGVDVERSSTRRLLGRCRRQGGLERRLPCAGATVSCPVREAVDPRRHARQVSQVQHVQPRRETFRSHRQQQHQLRVAVGRAQVLHLLDLPTPTRHDLRRDRPRRRADLANEPRDHGRRLPRRGS
jgi:hypothetical protein